MPWAPTRDEVDLEPNAAGPNLASETPPVGERVDKDDAEEALVTTPVAA